MKQIIVHSSLTKLSKLINTQTLRVWHKEARGWYDVGYHFIILVNGSIEFGRPLNRQSAGTPGHNKDSISICLIGGNDKDGNIKCNYTDEQKKALRLLVEGLRATYGISASEVYGHNDKMLEDSLIEPEDYLNHCPLFNVKELLEEAP